MKRDMTLKRKWLAAMLVAAALSFSVGQQAMAQTKQAVVVGSNVTAVKDGTADAVSTSDKTYVETTSGNTVTITTAAPPVGKVTKVTVKSYAVTSASDVNVPVTALTVTGTGGATDVSKGSTLQMTATAAPTYADWKAVTVTWSVASDTQSDNPGTASIDPLGVLTGTAEGDVVVTATATDVSGVTGQCTVTVVKPIPAGAIRGKFTINAGGEQVYFSQGNLQATTTDNGANWSWGFATNQWDLIGNDVANNAISGNGTVTYNGTVDLFGWSTAATTYGIHNSTTDSDYSGEFVDWGTLAITNGGNTENSGWRTLTIDEWTWLLGLIDPRDPNPDPNPDTNCRTSSTIGGTENARFAKAKLFDTTHGLIIFPDSYTHPDGVAVPTGINETDGTSWNANTYNATDWGKMEAAGCVFLPVAGRRWGTEIRYVDPSDNARVYYWSATDAGPSTAYPMRFREGTDDTGTNAEVDRLMGNVVRLVYPVPTE